MRVIFCHVLTKLKFSRLAALAVWTVATTCWKHAEDRSNPRRLSLVQTVERATMGVLRETFRQHVVSLGVVIPWPGVHLISPTVTTFHGDI